MDDLERYRRQNAILRGLVRNMAEVIHGLIDSMPNDLRRLENSRRATMISEKILHWLDAVDGNNEQLN